MRKIIRSDRREGLFNPLDFMNKKAIYDEVVITESKGAYSLPKMSLYFNVLISDSMPFKNHIQSNRKDY